MLGLKEALLQEQKRLEKILQRTTKQLQNAPSGELRLARSGKWTQYYRSLPGQKKNGIYIPKTNQKLICGLAQKNYDEKVLKLAEKRIKQITKITKDYEDDEIENVYLMEHPKRQKLIQPVEPTWDQLLRDWLSADYKRKEFQEGTPVILTERGERVRSKSEKILADYFYRKAIPYKYECPLYLEGVGIVYPDFTFLSKKTKQEIYWEHVGRMDDPSYAEKAIQKIHTYEKNNLYPGERLILTYETGKTILDMKLVEKLTARYLLA